MTFVHATMETRNFMFEAYASDQQACEELLFNAWMAHCEQTGADRDLWEELGINYRTVTLGTAWRDDWEIVS